MVRELINGSDPTMDLSEMILLLEEGRYWGLEQLPARPSPFECGSGKEGTSG